jgi:hypothetical protein
MDTFKKNGFQIAVGAIALVVILLILLFNQSAQSNKLYYSLLEGMWIAPAEFCMQSGIDGMMLYCGPDVGGYHKGYLLMYSDNAVAVAKAIEIRFSFGLPGLIVNPIMTNPIMTKQATIKTQDPEESIEDIMPEQQSITICLSTGHMEWTAWDADAGETRKYAEFYRDNISSSGANTDEN